MNVPPCVSRILIVGAGGFRREVLQWARDAWPSQASLIGGFLAADDAAAVAGNRLLPVIADPSEFNPGPGDAMLLAIGIPGVRRRVAETLAGRGGTFLTLIHPTAIVAPSATIGAGSILCPYSIVSDSAKLGRHVLLNYHASLGHDATAGDYAVFSPYAALGGHAHVGDDCFLGMHACVGPGRTVASRSKVSANSSALTDAPADSIVYGVPGRVAPRIVAWESAAENRRDAATSGEDDGT